MATKATAQHTRVDPPLQRDNDALLSSALDLLEEGFAIFDQDLTLVVRNAPFCRLYGFPDDLCRPGATLEALLRHDVMRGDCEPEAVEGQIANRMRKISGRELRQVEHEMPNGKIFLTRYDPISNGGLLITCRDVTERRRVEKALEASDERYLAEKLEQAQARLSEAIEAISEGFVLFDSEDRLVLCRETESVTRRGGTGVASGIRGWLLTPIRAWRRERVGYPDVARSSSAWPGGVRQVVGQAATGRAGAGAMYP